MYEDMGRIWGAVKVDDEVGRDGVSGVDFSDEKKAKDWLEAQSVEVRCAMASRAALRVCGNISLTSNEELPPIAIAVLRAIIISTTRGYIQTANIEWLETAAQSLDRSADRVSAAMSSDLSASCAANSADFAAFAAADFSATSSRESIVYSEESASYAFIRTTPKSISRSRLRASTSRITEKTYSAASRDSKNSSVTTFATPVWHSGTVPIPIEENHEALLAFFNEDRATWGFWHDWYLAMWEGQFTDWDLAVEVAKIPNEVWEEGAKAVAVEIEKLRARQDVRDALNDLPEVAASAISDRHGIGGNAPPEALEDVAQLVSQTTIIWAGVEALEKEAYAKKPDRERILAAISILQSGAAACLKWFGRKADLTIDTLIKWGVPAGAAHLLVNQQKVQTLIDAATKWAGLQ